MVGKLARNAARSQVAGKIKLRPKGKKKPNKGNQGRKRKPKAKASNEKLLAAMRALVEDLQ